MKVQLYIDPANQLSRVPYQVPNNIHYVKYQDYLDAQTQPDALTAYLYAAELAKDDIKKLKAEVERLNEIIRREVDGGVDLREEAQRTVEENHKLRAEVERLKAEKDQAECDHDNCQKRKVSIDNHRFDLFTENKNLKAEVERLKEDNRQLTKAFEIAEGIIKRMGKAAEDAAKEGKPSV